jgi:hypothetical protein
MERLGADPAGHVDYALRRQVGLVRTARAEQECLVGVSNVRRPAVILRIDGNRADSELAQRPKNADRDLAAIRDQNLREGHGRILSQELTLPDQLTIARALSVPVVVVLFEWNFPGHDYWATGVFIAAMSTDWFDGRIARRRGHISSLGTLLDPVADKLLVLSVLIVLIDQGVFPAGWSSRSSRASSSSPASASRRWSAASSSRRATSASSKRGLRPSRRPSAASPPQARGPTRSRGGRCSSRLC